MGLTVSRVSWSNAVGDGEIFGSQTIKDATNTNTKKQVQTIWTYFIHPKIILQKKNSFGLLANLSVTQRKLNR